MARDPFVEMYKEELDATGVPWEVVNGSKHKKVFVGGRMALVLPNCRDKVSVNPGMKRRAIRSIKAAAEAARRERTR